MQQSASALIPDRCWGCLNKPLEYKIMIVVCPNCSSRLQPNGNKPLVHPFTVRCPKCNSTVNSEPPNPASAQSALALGTSPATEHQRYQETEPAPLFQEGGKQATTQNSIDELGRLLGSLIGQGGASGGQLRKCHAAIVEPQEDSDMRDRGTSSKSGFSTDAERIPGVSGARYSSGGRADAREPFGCCAA